MKLDICTVRSPTDDSVGVGEKLRPGVDGLVVQVDGEPALISRCVGFDIVVGKNANGGSS